MNSKITCPVCQSVDIKTYTTVSAKQAATHFVVSGCKKYSQHRRDQLIKKIIGLWKSKKSILVSCNICKSLFCHPFVSGNMDFYRLAFDEGYPNERWEFDKTIQSLRKINNYRKLNYLEIGSGNGAFIRKLLKEGVLEKNIKCTEYSVDCVKKIRLMGVDCEKEDISTYSTSLYKNTKYDVICFFQVLEHQGDVHRFLKTINHHLKENGHIYMSVPNPERIIFNYKYGGLIDMPPNHVCEYSREAIKRIVRTNGWVMSNISVQHQSPLSIYLGIRNYQKMQRVVSKKSGQLQQSKNNNIVTLIKMVIEIITRNNLGDSQWISVKKHKG